MVKDSQAGLYPEKYFNELLTLEKKRRKRSEESAFLMLADLSAFTDESERQKIAQSMMDVLSNVIRDTDVKGWHVDGLVIGIIFTEMAYKGATSKDGTAIRCQQVFMAFEVRFGCGDVFSHSNTLAATSQRTYQQDSFSKQEFALNGKCPIYCTTLFIPTSHCRDVTLSKSYHPEVAESLLPTIYIRYLQ